MARKGNDQHQKTTNLGTEGASGGFTLVTHSKVACPNQIRAAVVSNERKLPQGGSGTAPPTNKSK
jgi:hypothetical protein